MSRTVKMRALMSLPPIEGRGAIKRGDFYQATEQEARDDVRMSRGAREAAKADTTQVVDAKAKA